MKDIRGRILELLDKKPCWVYKIADELGLYQSTVNMALDAFKTEGYVEEEPPNYRGKKVCKITEKGKRALAVWNDVKKSGEWDYEVLVQKHGREIVDSTLKTGVVELKKVTLMKVVPDPVEHEWIPLLSAGTAELMFGRDGMLKVLQGFHGFLDFLEDIGLFGYVQAQLTQWVRDNVQR